VTPAAIQKQHYLNLSLALHSSYLNSSYVLSKTTTTAKTTIISQHFKLISSMYCEKIGLLYIWDTELLGRRMYVDHEKLPLIIVTSEKLNGIYATSGYNVGTGDMLLRLM